MLMALLTPMSTLGWQSIPRLSLGGETKLRLVAIPAGMTINRVEALKLLRRGLHRR